MQQLREQQRPEAPRVVETPQDPRQVPVGLTNQLHNTAENVMKWKMQLEGEIKQRDDKISECQDMIKNMKSSLLSQQQHSEALSHKLQIELLKRGDINVRIETTRNICSSLQQHCNYLSDAMKKCFDEKNVIKTAQFEYVAELDRLMEKTENCNILITSLTKERDELLAAYITEKQDREKILEDVTTLKGMFQKKIDDAKKVIDKQAEKIAKLVESLNLGEEKSKALDDANTQLEQQLQLYKEKLNEKEELLVTSVKSLEQDLKDRDSTLCDERARYADLEGQLSTLQADFKNLEDTKNDVLECDSANKAQIAELTTKLTEIEQVVAQKSTELETLAEAKQSLENRLEIIGELQNELEKVNEELKVICEEKVCLAQKLSITEEDNSKLKLDLEKCQSQISESEVNFHEAKKNMEALKDANDDMAQRIKETDALLSKEKEENQQLKQKLEIEMNEALTLKSSLEAMSSASASESGVLNSQLLDMNSSLAKLKTQLQQKQEIISHLSTENEALKSNLTDMGLTLKSEQDCSTKKLSVLQAKLNEQEIEIKSSKSGQVILQDSVQALQEELDGLHVQLKEVNDDKETLLSEKKDLEKNLKTTKSEKTAAENKLKRLETKAANLEKEKKELKEKMTKARSESLQSSEKKDQALSDFEETIKEKDEQIAELEQSLNEAKSANEEELKSKEGKLVDALGDKKKLAEKLDTMVKEKNDLESKFSKMSIQLTDTIKNLNDISIKYEAQKQKLKEKIKTSQEQLSSKNTEVSKLQDKLSSQNSTLFTFEGRKTVPKSPTNSSDSSSFKRILKGGVSQMPSSGLKRKSIMKGTNRQVDVNKKLKFSDTIQYISLEDDDSSSVSSNQAPNTPTKSRTAGNIPTTPRKSPAIAKKVASTPKKSTPIKGGNDDDDAASDVSSVMDIVPMDEKEVEKRLEQIRSPARPMTKIESYSTPTKRLSVSDTDAPQKAKKSRLGGMNSRQSKYKNLEIN